MTESHGAEPDKHQLRPTALTPENAARLLSSLGGKTVTVEMIRADIDAGAPSNADGTINLVHYGAWLARLARRSLGEGGETRLGD